MTKRPSPACPPIRRSWCRAEMTFGSKPCAEHEQTRTNGARHAKFPTGKPKVVQLIDQIWQAQRNSSQNQRQMLVLSP